MAIIPILKVREKTEIKIRVEIISCFNLFLNINISRRQNIQIVPKIDIFNTQFAQYISIFR